MLNPSLQVAQALEFNLLPEDESVLAVVPIDDLIVELVELQGRTTLVGKTLGEELKRTNNVLVPKFELEETVNSLKVVTTTVEEYKEKMRQDQVAADAVQEALRADLARVEFERNQLLKEKVESEERERVLAIDLSNCHSFMLHINE